MLKPNSLTIFNYVKENDGKLMTAADIAEAVGLNTRQVNGTVTALAKKGLMVRTESEIEITKEDGSEGHKTVKFISLTDEGKSFDPTADAE